MGHQELDPELIELQPGQMLLCPDVSHVRSKATQFFTRKQSNRKDEQQHHPSATSI
jgi:hypothetical protein